MEAWQLAQLQSISLRAAEDRSERKIREAHRIWGGDLFVSLSGGLDSTVMLDIVRRIYPNIQAVFADTGLEYPELRAFVKTIPDVIWVKPKITFKQVVEKYGYPVGSKIVSRQIRELRNPTERNVATRRLYRTGAKRDGTISKCFKMPKKWLRFVEETNFKCSEQCCDVIKKEPLYRYAKETKRVPFIGTRAGEGGARASVYLKTGCNSFEGKHPKSMPLGFWTHQHVLEYILKHNLPYASCYGDIIKGKDGARTTTGEQRTGCMWCMFGVHLEKDPNRFQRMAETHPAQHNYCINKLGMGAVLDYMGVKYE